MIAAHQRHRAPKLFAVLTVLGLLLAACGSGGEGGASSTTVEVREQGTTEVDESDVDPNGTLRVAYDLLGTSRGGFFLDPLEQTSNIADDGVLYLLHGRLMRIDADGNLVPDLAESVEVVDPNTIEIRLRADATFQDGEPFDAEAVKAGLERTLAATDSPGLDPTFFSAESVEATAPDTVTISVPDGTAASWHDRYLGSWETSIVRDDFDATSNPVGAGPMEITEYVPEQKLVLERNEDYWDAESILPATVELLHAGSPSAALTAVRSGQADLSSLEATSIPELTAPVKAAVRADTNNLANLMLCKAEGPLSDPTFRRAINKAIDREAITEALFSGAAVPSTTLWPEGHRFYSEGLAEELAYDPEAARELLAESEHPEGAEFDLYVLQSNPNPAVAEIIQQQLEEIGVSVNLIPAPNFVEQFIAADVPGAGMIPTFGGDRFNHWTGDGISNVCNYEDPEIEAAAAELATVSTFSQEAVDLWHDVEEIVVRDALSVILYFGPKTAAYNEENVGEPAFWEDQITFYDMRSTYVKKK